MRMLLFDIWSYILVREPQRKRKIIIIHALINFNKAKFMHRVNIKLFKPDRNRVSLLPFAYTSIRITQ